MSERVQTIGVHFVWRIYYWIEKIGLWFRPFNPDRGVALGLNIANGRAYVSFIKKTGPGKAKIVCQLPQGLEEMRKHAEAFQSVADQLEVFHGK